MGLEEEAVISLLQGVASDHQIRSAFTRGSLRGAIYVEGVLDANTTFLLSSIPGIIRKQSGIVRHAINPSDWVKLLTMKDPTTVVKACQWVRVRKGAYEGELGFVTHVEAWGARVLVVPRLKAPTPRAATSLKRKRTPIKPEPSLFDPVTFSTMFQREPKLHYNGSYTSRGLVFHHGLLQLNLDLHSISLNSARIPSRILKVVVNDGETYKDRDDVAVSIVRVDGVVSIRHYVYNASRCLPPAWVSLRRPNPTRDNGLLVVVEGEHCGKRVRRIHHRYSEENGNKQVLIMLAVVEKVGGAPDILTGEQLELCVDSLCLASETKEEKKLNANLMSSLRESARSKRR